MSAITKEDLKSEIESAKINAVADAKALIEKAMDICDKLEIDFYEMLEEMGM